MASCIQTDLPKNYFDAHKLLLKCIGLSLAPKQGIIYKIYSVFVLVLMVPFPFLVLFDLFRNKSNFDDYLNNLVFGTGCTIIASEQILIYLRGPQLRKIMDYLENDDYLHDFKYREPEETIWIKDCVALTRKLSIGGTVMGIGNVAVCVLTAFPYKEDDSHSLPFGTLSMLTDHLNFKIVFLYESTVLFGEAIVYMMTGVIYASIVLYICVQLRILQNFIQRMDRITYTIMNKDKNVEQLGTNEADVFKPSSTHWKYLQEPLKEAVIYHLSILNLSQKAEDFFNVIIFTETVGMAFTVCCLIYHTTLFPMTDSRFYKDIGLLSCALSTFLLMSYFGNEVIVESMAIADACYKVNFVGTDIKFQKGLMLITQRSQRPITFTAGKFAILSLVTVVQFFRAIYSYYMLLRNMHED